MTAYPKENRSARAFLFLYYHIFFETLLQTSRRSVLVSEDMKKDLLTYTFERIRSQLHLKARQMLSDDEEARDVLQDAFFKLWTVHAKIESESSATGLLVTTVRNLSIDRLRRQKSHPSCSIDERLDYEPDNAAEEQEYRQEVLADVQTIIERHLSARDREILLLRDRDEWSFEEIALRFDITEANARLIVARARKTIRNIYNNRK